MKRRTFLSLSALAVFSGLGYRYWPDEGILNPCPSSSTPKELLQHELVVSAWEGLRVDRVWDCHTHLIGAGDTDSGIHINAHMRDPWYPAHNLRYRFYLNAACAGQGSVDTGVLQHLKHLYDEYRVGARFLLLAFDARYDEQGRRDEERTPFFIPNDYAAKVARQDPGRLGWIASVHPYRQDCVEALSNAKQAGAVAIKWLPPVMAMDPSSPLCDRFYEALVRLELPLLTHAGHEYAVAGVDSQNLGNPLLLRRPLEHGVRVIVAHCASEGKNPDLDKKGATSYVHNFDLFARMMGEQRYEKHLFGDISAITQLNRLGKPLRTILKREDWHTRLLNGSDYPLPGVMPLFSAHQMAERGYITESEAKVLKELRRYNPLLSDFVLKRTIRLDGKYFATSVFETRRAFDPLLSAS